MDCAFVPKLPTKQRILRNGRWLLGSNATSKIVFQSSEKQIYVISSKSEIKSIFKSMLHMG